MKICVLQSSQEGSGLSWLEEVEIPARPDVYTDQHEFVYRFIRKDRAREEIDAVVAEGFDFYFNFIWGTPDDPVTGAEESKYFESFGLPSSGIRSEERFMTKNQFYQNALARGGPPIPGRDKFPLFVKPSNGSASQFIDEQSICHNQDELDGALARISNHLRAARVRRAKGLGHQGQAEQEAFADACARQGRDSHDVVVQEFIPGVDMTCTVLQMGEGCLALTPFVYKTKATTMRDHFLTFDLKFDEGTTIQLLNKAQDPSLYERIQRVAIDGLRASGCGRSNMGCDVDVRVRPDGAIYAIEVNPQPAAFMPEGAFQDLPIIHSLPGRHHAVINIFIANQLLEGRRLREASDKVADVYDTVAPRYNHVFDDGSGCTIVPSLEKIVATHDFGGVVFDLGCGTGIFGKVLGAADKNKNEQDRHESTQLLGFDISPGMLQLCQECKTYDATILESMETALVHYRRYAHTIDHIVSFTAIHFLRPEVFSFFMALCFALANKSITVTVDEIPDHYNETLIKMGYAHMYSNNHLKAMEAFGEPPGWRLERGKSQFSWTSPTTGDDIYSTCFRFERIEGASRDIMFSLEELPN